MNVIKQKKEDLTKADFAYYKILRSLEEERVFLVTSLIDGTISALKIANKDSLEDFTFNLKREFVMHANFEHPNIVKLGEAHEDETRFGFTTSYVGGGDLRERIKTIEIHQVPLILRDVAMGLADIHDKGFVHADIKPENILISTNGTPVICDFGVARDLKARRVDSKSMIFGTTKYISPEYLLEGDLGAYTDIYSLGLIALELFSGSIPGENLDAIEMLKERVRSYGSNIFDPVPAELRGLIKSSLEVSPKNRIRDGAQFVEAINEHIAKASLEEGSLQKHIRLRVSSDIRPIRVRKRTEPIRVDKRVA